MVENGLKGLGFAEEEGRSCYSSGHLKTRVIDPDLSTNMEVRVEGSEMVPSDCRDTSGGDRKSLGNNDLAGKMGVLTLSRFLS